jgi:hypothetical protein
MVSPVDGRLGHRVRPVPHQSHLPSFCSVR